MDPLSLWVVVVSSLGSFSGLVVKAGLVSSLGFPLESPLSTHKPLKTTCLHHVHRSSSPPPGLPLPLPQVSIARSGTDLSAGHTTNPEFAALLMTPPRYPAPQNSLPHFQGLYGWPESLLLRGAVPLACVCVSQPEKGARAVIRGGVGHWKNYMGEQIQGCKEKRGRPSAAACRRERGGPASTTLRGACFLHSQLPEHEAEPGSHLRPLKGSFMPVPECLILCFQYIHHTT